MSEKMARTVVSVDVAAALAEQGQVVEAAIDGLLPVPDGHERRLIEAMRYATLGGGKRLRGFLVMEVAGLFGVAQAAAARVAASVEMMHAYSLVHDDLPAMDDDDLRRGQPSTHKQFDEATAILAGDALQTRAFEVLAEAETHGDALAPVRPGAGAGAGERWAGHGSRADDRHGDRGGGAECGRGGPAAGAEDRAADPV